MCMSQPAAPAAKQLPGALDTTVGTTWTVHGHLRSITGANPHHATIPINLGFVCLVGDLFNTDCVAWDSSPHVFSTTIGIELSHRLRDPQKFALK